MYTIMICEYNLQPDLCCLYHRAVDWFSPEGLRGFGAGQSKYPSTHSNIPVIPPEEYYVYI